MGLRNKIAAAMLAAGVMAFSSVSHAIGEMENVTVTVFVNPIGAPLGFLETDLTHPQGIDIDIIHELQRRLLFNLRENRIFPLQRSEGFARLQNGTADIVIGGISRTPEREKLFAFTPVYFGSGLTVVHSKVSHPEMKTLDDVKGLRVGYERGSSAETFARQSGANAVPFDNLTLALIEVANGDLDAIIYDRPPVADFVRMVPSVNLATIDQIFNEEACQFAFAMPKDYKYADIINATIEEMLQDGTIEAILKRWEAQ